MRFRSIAPVLGLAALGLSTMAAPAGAADFPVLRGSQIDDAPPPPVDFFSGDFNWTGYYLGGGAGVSATKFQPGTGLQDLANFAFRNTLLGAESNMGSFVNNLPSKTDSGATYFGMAGYNLAFGDAVLGLEVDYTRSDQSYRISDFIARRTITSNGSVNDWSMTTQQGAVLHDYITARIRMGWAYGRFMPFATIGGAVGRFDTVSTITATNFITQVNPVTGAISSGMAVGYPLTVGEAKKNVYGYGLAVGAGVDMALTDNLFLRGEYQLIRFADVEGTTTTVNTARVAAGMKF